MGRFLRGLQCAGVLTLPSGLAPEIVASSTKEWESFALLYFAFIRKRSLCHNYFHFARVSLLVVELFSHPVFIYGKNEGFYFSDGGSGLGAYVILNVCAV
jgi:hypothetical protein